MNFELVITLLFVFRESSYVTECEEKIISQVESTLKMLKDDLTAMDDAESKRLKLVRRNFTNELHKRLYDTLFVFLQVPRKENEVKLTRMANIKAKIIHEAKHYYHGFRFALCFQIYCVSMQISLFQPFGS